MEKIRKLAVLGAGNMGHGIAEVCAIAGYSVMIRDIKQEFVNRGMKMIKDSLEKLKVKGKINNTVDEIISRITPTIDLAEAVRDADLIIEAVPEVFETKIEIFKQCDNLAKPDCIFTTNTSTIRITDLANATNRKERFGGLHFFNPPILMQLVEIIRGENTDEDTIKILFEFVKTIGKTPVRVEKDVPGFVANRVVAPANVLLFGILEKGIATPEEIDATMRKTGVPMGPFELMDFNGVDVRYNVMKYYAKTISPEYEPPKIIEEMVNKGLLGAKTGRGWYDWTFGRPHIDLTKATDKIDPLDFTFVEINEAAKLVEMGVATPQDIDTALNLGYSRQKGPFEILKHLNLNYIIKRLNDLAKEYNKNIFQPAQILKSGKILDWLKE